MANKSVRSSWVVQPCGAREGQARGPARPTVSRLRAAKRPLTETTTLDRSWDQCLLPPAPHETNVPTAQHASCPDARISRTNVDAGRPPSAPEPTPKRPQASGADRLQEVVASDAASRESGRLRKHVEFVRAQRLGRRVATAHFTLLVAAQPRPFRSPRLGLVVARKVGGAVQRNRVKRLCRECFRLWPGLVPEGIDLIVIARAKAHELGLAAVRSEWQGVEAMLKKRAAEALARAADPDHPGTGDL